MTFPGGRKFFGVMTVIWLSALFLIIERLTGGEWVTVNTLALGIFGGANVWQKRGE